MDSIIDNYKFEKVEDFKYLEVNINSRNDMYVEMIECIMSKNICRFQDY